MREICVEKTASRGIAVAPFYKYEIPDMTPRMGIIQENDIAGELEAYARAKESIIEDLVILSEEHEIFQAHVEIAKDFMLEDSVKNKIESKKMNVQQAVSETITELAEMFVNMDDDYMKERSADVMDIGKRYMAKLKGVELPDIRNMNREVIVVAKDLYPSDTVKLDTKYVKGILTQEGGITSHVCIMANSMNIPIIVGVAGIIEMVSHDSIGCMDAEQGTIVIEPSEEVKVRYENKKSEYLKELARLEALRGENIVDETGKQIALCVNVGSLEEIRQAKKRNIHGVGLFRTEFLYMNHTQFPTEEEQFLIYQEAAKLSPQELTIRTLDIGGDKALPYYEFPSEENPFLGWRAIRISLELKDMFKEQIRAILRASAYGHVRMMFPMIISMEELLEAKALVEECKQELKSEGRDYDETIEIGMMIETPASVLLAETFAREVDFFSIGTNDLTQYLLVVDRGNQKIAHMYDYFHPAVLKAIERVVRLGHNAGITVGMCGEMAADTKAIKILLKIGLDEFSVSVGSADHVRACILDK